MTKSCQRINGKNYTNFPHPTWFETMSLETYLKKHTEALVKDVGIEVACGLTGKSKATLGRYYTDQEAHGDRFMLIDVVARLEAASSFPHVA